ncbi:two component system response regulator [Paludibacterium purpuratum]|uniref:LuxR family two component transcriptional regulator n=1 Tax=Paludibacterium purpuratum TaxID=1144873 RepID=A0A4R7B0Z8_9NEIS|nr:two component system response regulator [Paludibacterium purpuratum]TDR76592.1 LuxR family two component transcriptional regulator [Paludibacterium purpuratum]
MNVEPLRVLIVEDHGLLADGVRYLLERQACYQVAGVVLDGCQVYQACLELQPELVLLDLGLPGMDGIDVIHLLRKRWPGLRILVFSAEAGERRCMQALGAGAMGYVLKRSARHVLLEGLSQVAAGRCYVDPALGGEPLCWRPAAGDGLDERLTPRERQILKLIAEGKRNREIASYLSVSIKTVETHRCNLMRKLDAHNAAELSTWARRIGLVEC